MDAGGIQAGDCKWLNEKNNTEDRTDGRQRMQGAKAGKGSERAQAEQMQATQAGEQQAQACTQGMQCRHASGQHIFARSHGGGSCM